MAAVDVSNELADVEVDEIMGDELERPMVEVRLLVGTVSVTPGTVVTDGLLNARYCTVSFLVSKVSSGKRPSETASTMHGSSPLMRALDKLTGRLDF